MASLEITPEGNHVFKDLLVEVEDANSLTFKNPLPVTVDFDPTKAVGTAYLSKTAEGITESVTLRATMVNLNLTPAIAFWVDKKVYDEKMETAIITEGRITSVSLCSTPNQDPRIKSLFAQTVTIVQ